MTEVAEQISQRTKDHAMRIEEQMLAVAGEFKSRYWTLGLGAAEISEKRLWEVRGFSSEQAYRNFLDIGRSTYFRCRRLATEIAKPLLKKELVTRARLNRLTLENAEQLLRLDERRRFSASWVEKAITMKETEFEIEVDNVLLNGDDEETTTKDPLSVMKIRMLQSQRDVIEATFEEFRTHMLDQDVRLEADDLAGILEGLCADWHNSRVTETV